MIMVQQMVILFMVMLVGLLANKIGILKGESVKKISSLVVNISNPCFVVSSVLGDNTGIKNEYLLTIAIAAIAMYAVLILIAAFIPVILRVPKKDYGVYRAMTVFNNIGFMGLPIISGVYGTGALLYAAVFMLPYNVLIYSYGVYVMKTGTEGGSGFKIKSLINPGVVAAILAIIIYFTHIKMPVVITSTVNMIGNITAPLCMMVIGASFATMDFKKTFADIHLLIFSFIKLIIIPVVGILLLGLFVKDPVLKGICLIMLATPIGSMVPMLATEYGGDEELGATGVAMTSILSVATLALIFVIVG